MIVLKPSRWSGWKAAGILRPVLERRPSGRWRLTPSLGWGGDRSTASAPPRCWQCLGVWRPRTRLSPQRLRQICGQVFRYAVATGRLDRDPTTALRGSLKTAKNRHDASITDPVKVGELLRAIDDGLLCSMSAVGHCGERVACPRGTTLPAKASLACSNASGSIAQRIPHSMPPGPMCSNTSNAATTPGCDGAGSSRIRNFQPFPNSQ